MVYKLHHKNSVLTFLYTVVINNNRKKRFKRGYFIPALKEGNFTSHISYPFNKFYHAFDYFKQKRIHVQ